MSETLAPTAPKAAQRCGGFTLGPLRLALPMEALREVLPCTALQPLPCSTPGLVGSIDLRGRTLPVIDLRGLLGQPMPVAAPAGACVVVMGHAGGLLGLLADDVTSVFTAGPQAASAMVASASPGASPLLFSHCVADDTGRSCSMLQPEAVAAASGAPLAAAGAVVAAAAAGAGATARPVPTLLLRCGRVLMAIDAVAVQSTLADPQLDTTTALAQGHCRGLVRSAQGSVPAVDLLALCGLERGPQRSPPQAIVIALATGSVALMVDEVLDIVDRAPDALMPLPAFALPRAALFAGVLQAPSGSSPGDSQDTGDAGTPVLLLSAQALHDDDLLLRIAAAGAPAPGRPGEARAGSTSASAARPGRMLVTYALQAETATPLDQVREILGYTPALSTFAGDGPMLGLTVHRGRAIPVLCLSRLTGGPPPEVTPAASVLVVEAQGALVGFAVPALRAIEPARWEPGQPRRSMALVGEGASERMLPLIDLQQLARSLQA